MSFGDGISWDRHVDEIFSEKTEDEIWYKPDYNSLIAKIIYDHEPQYWQTVRDQHGPEWKPNLLDCGCHIGRWCGFFEGIGFRYVGIDQSRYALNKAQAQFPDTTFVQSYLWDFDLSEKQNDVAVCVAVLQHNTRKERERIIPNIRMHLSPGGLFFFTESTIDEAGQGTETYEWWLNLAQSNGFEHLETRNRDSYMFKAI